MFDEVVIDVCSSVQKLYTQLKEVYTEENLNQITAKIIALYKAKYHFEIKNILSVVIESLGTESFDDNCKISKIFSKLILLYHPDKLFNYLNVLEVAKDQNNIEKLNQISHIFLTISELEKLSVIKISHNSNPCKDNRDKDYSGWEDFYSSEKERFTSDFDEDEYFDNEYEYYDMGEEGSLGKRKKDFSFYDIVVEENIFNDLDQIDMSNLNISDLDGVEDFVYLKVLNLSGNKITDVSDLMELERLEELYLGQNQIGYIDRLCNLKNLKILDLSDNDIDDISVLFDLYNLEFVNLMNNPVSKTQIKELIERKVVVII